MVSYLISMKVWTVLGTLASVSFGLFGLYITYYDDKPVIEVLIEEEFRVLDIDNALPSLEIIYEGEILDPLKTNISVFRISVKNTGTRDILINHYDPGIGWGLHFKDGKIIDARLVGASSVYLRQNFGVASDDSRVTFSQPIFEIGNEVRIDVAIIHDSAKQTSIGIFGKIVGIQWGEIQSSSGISEQSFLDELLFGSVGTHVVRFFLYFFSLILFGVVVGFLAYNISNIFESIRRKKIRTALSLINVDNVERENFLVDIYVNEGVAGVESLKKTMSSDQNVRAAKEYYDKRVKLRIPRIHEAAFSQLDLEQMNEIDVAHDFGEDSARPKGQYWGPLSRNFEELRELGIVAGGARGRVKIDESFRDQIDELLLRLR